MTVLYLVLSIAAALGIILTPRFLSSKKMEITLGICIVSFFTCFLLFLNNQYGTEEYSHTIMGAISAVTTLILIKLALASRNK